MTKYNCRFCSRYFNTNETLKNHETRFHRHTDADDKSEETDSNESVCSSLETEVESEVEEDLERATWKELLKEAIEKIENRPEDNSLLTKEPFFTELYTNFRDGTEEFLNEAKALKEGDLYTKITATAEKLQSNDEDYGEEESYLAAWDRRKNLVKTHIVELVDELSETESVMSDD